AVAVVGTQPLWGAFRGFLRALGDSQNPRERLVVNFVAETPLPPPGFVVSVTMPELGPGIPVELELQRPPPNQLPLLDLPVRLIFELLKPETVVLMVE
ncbi:unnamed protein product, partial [Polarella glacialis]